LTGSRDPIREVLAKMAGSPSPVRLAANVLQ